jgi:hypothetical protein
MTYPGVAREHHLRPGLDPIVRRRKAYAPLTNNQRDGTRHRMLLEPVASPHHQQDHAKTPSLP